MSHVATQFVAKARSNHWMTTLVTAAFGHWVQDDFTGPAGIMATRRGLERLRGDLVAIMRLVDLANLYDKPIAPATWDAMRRMPRSCPTRWIPNPAASSSRCCRIRGGWGRCCAICTRPICWRGFIPAFRHARGLLQFNQYHKYTVDEHCLRAVECATELGQDPGPLGCVYRSIVRKNILHLALLIHDLGKGHPEDHVPLGVQIATEAAARLHLPPYETAVLKFLVENHQVMDQPPSAAIRATSICWCDLP